MTVSECSAPEPLECCLAGGVKCRPARDDRPVAPTHPDIR